MPLVSILIKSTASCLVPEEGVMLPSGSEPPRVNQYKALIVLYPTPVKHRFLQTTHTATLDQADLHTTLSLFQRIQLN